MPATLPSMTGPENGRQRPPDQKPSGPDQTHGCCVTRGSTDAGRIPDCYHQRQARCEEHAMTTDQSQRSGTTAQSRRWSSVQASDVLSSWAKGITAYAGDPSAPDPEGTIVF